MAFPACIEAVRIGHYPETDTDVFGELAPITWKCGCGSRLCTEFFDHEEEDYVPVSEERKAEFLAAHSSCTPTCFKCRKVPVTFNDGWCVSCVVADGQDPSAASEVCQHPDDMLSMDGDSIFCDECGVTI